MKSKIVIWGEKANEEKVLLALELQEAENQVNIYVFPLEVATEDFYQKLRNKWQNNEEVEFPQPYEKIERKLSVTESILPEELKVQQTDVIVRAQTEWHFIVLASKMYEVYKNELDELKDKIDNLNNYDESAWEEMKSFWAKVQDQVRDKNLFRDQANILKERVNNLFDKLKNLKKEFEKEIDEKSSEVSAEFFTRIDEVKERVEKGIGFAPLFDEMKKIQNEFFEATFSRNDRNKVYKKIDEVFKLLKEKKGVEDAGQKNNNLSRLESRFSGLLAAIKKMENSIALDLRDQKFENNKIKNTDGQLELQIRQAKLIMIEERIKSKQLKLDDMLKTRKELEKKLEKEKVNAAEREKEKNEKAEKAKVKKEVIEKINEEIKANEKAMEDVADKLETAAHEIKESKKKTAKSLRKDNISEALGATVGNAIDQLTDSVKAVAKVIEDEVSAEIEKYAFGEEE
jgi:hypothetical protein